MGKELGKLNKQQLIAQVKALEEQREWPGTDQEDNLLHELQVHQIELEMQNRELLESQQQLEEVRDRYADLYDFAPVCYISFDKAGIIKNINLTGADMLDQVRSFIIDRPFSRWVVKGHLGHFFNHLHKALQSDSKASDQIQIKSKNGIILDILIESSRRMDLENGSFTCQSVLLDITEQKKSEKEVSLKARQLKIITDTVPVLIAYINSNEEFQFVNKTCTDWFGVSPARIIGRSIYELWDENNFRELYQQIRLSLLGKQLTFEMKSPFFSNEKKFISITLIPDYDNANLVQGVIMMAGDITKRLQQEAENRTRLLNSAHIARLSSMGEMASEIAHELNQPLAAISIYSDACQRMIKSEKSKPEQLIKTLDDIHQQAVRAGEVIRRIRAFAARKELVLESVGIDELIKEAMQLIEVELRSHNIKLQLLLPDDIVMVMADRILIEQVILNLVRNAMEAMEALKETERFLKIYVHNGSSEKIEVSIEDSGPGMTQGQIKQIFEAFHTTKINGMGLGLAICHSIIEVHRGRIWSEQNVKGGTTFHFTLPLSGAN